MPVGLSAEGVTHRFGRRCVLADASIDVPLGVTALIGQNGAGKTTLIRILGGLLWPDSATVRHECDSTAADVRVGVMPQFTETVRWLSVHTYLRYAAYLAGASWQHAKAESQRLQELVDLTDLAPDPTSRLSGGQRRRLALAAALAGDPDVLLLDEPTAGLDPMQRDAMVASIAQLGRSKAVLISTHLVEDVATVADRIVLLHHGMLHAYPSLNSFAEAHGCGPRDERPSPEELRAALRAALASQIVPGAAR